MYAMNIQNDVIGLVLRENCKSKQMTDFIAWPSRCHYMMHLIKLVNRFQQKYLFKNQLVLTGSKDTGSTEII
jgi:hypothetical protein